MSIKTKICKSLIIFVIFSLSGCGGGGGETPPSPAPSAPSPQKNPIDYKKIILSDLKSQIGQTTFKESCSRYRSDTEEYTELGAISLEFKDKYNLSIFTYKYAGPLSDKEYAFSKELDKYKITTYQASEYGEIAVGLAEIENPQNTISFEVSVGYFAQSYRFAYRQSPPGLTFRCNKSDSSANFTSHEKIFSEILKNRKIKVNCLNRQDGRRFSEEVEIKDNALITQQNIIYLSTFRNQYAKKTLYMELDSAGIPKVNFLFFQGYSNSTGSSPLQIRATFNEYGDINEFRYDLNDKECNI
jgi:hypothetical protein